ncbi:hypothetical protein PSACC_03444 [Paramicrosporidium saccamoebae]|uniref:DUS-like FMN-binding domain-containing protein n=1 Tax=Paramicrosporidium saccamoebae TaxID=1246581 RepID=A0A2H9TG81_9FUNG|nr:hypothetical protein PSACC_03444 [Paramicrosporidium saccamoebae]
MLSYEGKIVLAPMVRVGTLPMRLLALEYGADLVWTPEIIDKKLLTSTRTVNTRLNTVDYISNRTLVLRLHPCEKPKLVLQLGSADPELALQAARMVAPDVAGVDLNCGCPKHFSVHAGMGAALLSEPDRLCNILKRLVTGLPGVPVTAKIRLLPDQEKTLELVKRIGATGIRALTVHCRTPADRPRHPAKYDMLAEIVKVCPVPVIANGDFFDRSQFAGILETGVRSIMLARAAQWNVSIFRTEGLLDPMEVSKAYLKKAIEVENPFSNTKYTVLQMWLDRPYSDKNLTRKLQSCKSMAELCGTFNMEYIPTEPLDLDNGEESDEVLCN